MFETTFDVIMIDYANIPLARESCEGQAQFWPALTPTE